MIHLHLCQNYNFSLLLIFSSSLFCSQFFRKATHYFSKRAKVLSNILDYEIYDQSLQSKAKDFKANSNIYHQILQDWNLQWLVQPKMKSLIFKENQWHDASLLMVFCSLVFLNESFLFTYMYWLTLFKEDSPLWITWLLYLPSKTDYWMSKCHSSVA